MTRKLTTILAADVAGYSQLVEQDEQGTLEALRKAREVVTQAVVSHNGRVFGGAGDSIIADFGSAVEATKAAVAIQKEIGNRRASNLEEPDLFNRLVDDFVHQVDAGRWDLRDPRSTGNSLLSRK